MNEKAEKICAVLHDRKAQRIVHINVSELTIVADSFVIASGRSTLQVKALCDEVEEKLAQEGQAVRRKDGYAAGRWIVMDYEDVLVHIFHEEERQFYNLERLWVQENNTSYYPPEGE